MPYFCCLSLAVRCLTFEFDISFAMFDVEWPPLLSKSIIWVVFLFIFHFNPHSRQMSLLFSCKLTSFSCEQVKGTIRFDVLQLPTISCLWHGVEWWTVTTAYTLFPLCLIGVLAVPVAAAYFRSLHTLHMQRMQETVDKFWRNSMWTLFILCKCEVDVYLSIIL